MIGTRITGGSVKMQIPSQQACYGPPDLRFSRCRLEHQIVHVPDLVSRGPPHLSPLPAPWALSAWSRTTSSLSSPIHVDQPSHPLLWTGHRPSPSCLSVQPLNWLQLPGSQVPRRDGPFPASLPTPCCPRLGAGGGGGKSRRQKEEVQAPAPSHVLSRCSEVGRQGLIA